MANIALLVRFLDPHQLIVNVLILNALHRVRPWKTWNVNNPGIAAPILKFSKFCILNFNIYFLFFFCNRRKLIDKHLKVGVASGKCKNLNIYVSESCERRRFGLFQNLHSKCSTVIFDRSGYEVMTFNSCQSLPNKGEYKVSRLK